MNRKHDVVMSQKENQMDGLADNLTTLNAFKDTKTTREENLKREELRF